MKKILLLSLIFILIFTLSSCSKNASKEYSNHYIYFGTEISITIYTSDSEKAIDMLDYASSFFKDYSRLSDRFFAFEGITNIYSINHSSDSTFILDDRLLELIDYSIKNADIKDEDDRPYFTIGIGSISDIYYDLFSNYNGKVVPKELFPGDDQLSANYLTDVSSITIDKDNHTLTKPVELKLDLGGIAKGYVIELLSDYYDKNDIKYIINSGSSNIITNIGNPKRNNKLLIGLYNPEYKTKESAYDIYAILNAPLNKAIVSSGDYQNFFYYENKIFSHILDPYTKKSANTDIRSITIITSCNAYGDILSTSLYMMGSKKALEYLNNSSDTTGIIFRSDGVVLSSSGMKEFITLKNGYKYGN